MAHDAREVGNFLLDRAELTGAVLTHLGLQKILYFAHAWHLGKYGTPLIGQRFEAWQYGPVVRVVFDQLKVFKDHKINTRLKKVDGQTGEFIDASYDFDLELCSFLESIYEYYGRIDPRRLIDLTHEAGGPWEKVWTTARQRSVVGMYIPDETIRMWILREGGREGKIRH